MEQVDEKVSATEGCQGMAKQDSLSLGSLEWEHNLGGGLACPHRQPRDPQPPVHVADVVRSSTTQTHRPTSHACLNSIAPFQWEPLPR